MNWMIENQMSRRNMTKFQWAEVVLKRKESIAAKALQNQRVGVRLESNKGADRLQKYSERLGTQEKGRVGTLAEKVNLIAAISIRRTFLRSHHSGETVKQFG